MDNSVQRSVQFDHPTGYLPKQVIMLLLGDSKRQYADIQSISHDRRFPGEAEIWTCNAGFRIWDHDVCFVMDDLEEEAYKWPSYGDDLEHHDKPIITSKAYERWPQAVEYPYAAVCQSFGLQDMDRYFCNTVPYMLAYALLIGVERVTIFGADYWHPSSPGREADLANAEWWLGFCRAKGMVFTLADNTTLMRANDRPPTYGYRFDPNLALDRASAARRSEKIKADADARAEMDHAIRTPFDPSAPNRIFRKGVLKCNADNVITEAQAESAAKEMQRQKTELEASDMEPSPLRKWMEGDVCT